MRNTLRFLFVGALLVGGVAGPLGGCGNNPMSMADMATTTKACATGVICTNSTIPDQSMDLATSGTPVMFNVLANTGYSGTVKVDVNRSAIDSISGGADPDVGIAVVPATFQLMGGKTQQVSVTFTTTTAAAAFNAKTITLHVSDMADSTKNFDVPVKLTVNPNLTITFTGDGVNTKHTWSTDNGATVNFNVRSRPTAPIGTNFTFVNKGTGSHIIHGDPMSIHQDPTGTGTAPNATYTVSNFNGTVNTANTYGFYCHSDGINSSMPGGERYIIFIP